jgi:hypothetical protein
MRFIPVPAGDTPMIAPMARKSAAGRLRVGPMWLRQRFLLWAVAPAALVLAVEIGFGSQQQSQQGDAQARERTAVRSRFCWPPRAPSILP